MRAHCWGWGCIVWPGTALWCRPPAGWAAGVCLEKLSFDYTVHLYWREAAGDGC